jgi:tungstate transport system ATP-binding protein
MSSMLNLQFNNLCKRYRRRNILVNLDITLRDGECTLLCGSNGAGKTTLLRIMAGLEKPDLGTIDFGFGQMKWRRCKKTLQEKIMYLHQQPYMFDTSVRKNLAYALPSGLSNAECSQRIDEALEWADLRRLATAPATNLSGGEAQRVALARAWLRTPLVLLLDEPMANMDQESRLRTHNLLRQLKDQGMAIIITSHDTMQFQSLSDRQLILKDGKISIELSTNQAENVTAFPLAQTSLHDTA